jgi:hypothetical protein
MATTRRGFLIGSAVVVAGALGGVAAWRPWSSSDKRGITGYFGDDNPVRAIGAAFLKRQPTSDADLARAIAPSTSTATDWVDDAAVDDVEARLADLAKADAERDRFVVIDGWRLPRSEWEACALYANRTDARS